MPKKYCIQFIILWRILKKCYKESGALIISSINIPIKIQYLLYSQKEYIQEMVIIQTDENITEVHDTEIAFSHYIKYSSIEIIFDDVCWTSCCRLLVVFCIKKFLTTHCTNSYDIKIKIRISGYKGSAYCHYPKVILSNKQG